MQKVYDCIAYSTKRIRWVSSGTVPSDISMALFRPDNVLIESKTAVASGNGHYYAVLLHDPTSAMGNWVIQETKAVINGQNYITRQFGKIRDLNVGSP